jgi:glyoxylase-like metal-dependent hydrolase (beta-lactamase superfamily II)
MNMKSSFLYHFYPVGQGLFSTGSIHLLADREAEFRWVYDCGTTSAGSLIVDSIEKLERDIDKRNRIDLLTLSHFDKDHISGVTALLEKFKIGTLLLPYLTLEQRLVLIFEQGIETDDPLITFYINPVEYLLQQEGPGINRILFVPASGEQGTPP